MAINWGDDPQFCSNIIPALPKGQPGSSYRIKQVAFIGDTVTPGQPPFFSNADIDAWLVSLHELQLARFKDFIARQRT